VIEAFANNKSFSIYTLLSKYFLNITGSRTTGTDKLLPGILLKLLSNNCESLKCINALTNLADQSNHFSLRVKSGTKGTFLIIWLA
jgi:hypothetical protein